jgi:hypothetical protein
VANVIIKLMRDGKTGKRTVVVSYESDADSLPMEHEEEHRRLVNQLIEKGLAKAGDTIVVDRGQPSQPNEEPGAQTEGERESVEEKA